MYCFFQSSEYRLSELEKELGVMDVVSPEMKQPLCGAIRDIWSFYGKKSIGFQDISIIKRETKLRFYLFNFNPSFPKFFVRLRFPPKEQYKIRIEEWNSPFRSIGISITGKKHLIDVLSYLSDIIECEKIVEEKTKQNTIIQEFIKKINMCFSHNLSVLIMQRAVRYLFKHTNIKTKEQMANLQKTIEVKITKSENQTNQFEIKISMGGRSVIAFVYCEDSLYMNKQCCGIKFLDLTGNNKVFFLFSPQKAFQKIKEEDQFNLEMNRISGLNKDYKETALETNQNDLGPELNDETNFDKNEETALETNQNDLGPELNNETNFDKKDDSMSEKETKRSPMKLTVIIIILLITLFLYFRFCNKKSNIK